MAKKNKQSLSWLWLLLVAASPVVGYLGSSYFLNDGTKNIDINGLEIVSIILLMLLVFFLVILIHEIGKKKPSMSKVFLNAFEAALAFKNGDIAEAKAFAEKVMTTTEKKGATKLYQKILSKAIQ